MNAPQGQKGPKVPQGPLIPGSKIYNSMTSLNFTYDLDISINNIELNKLNASSITVSSMTTIANGHIYNLNDPENLQDLLTKKFVDSYTSNNYNELNKLFFNDNNTLNISNDLTWNSNFLDINGIFNIEKISTNNLNIIGDLNEVNIIPNPFLTTNTKLILPLHQAYQALRMLMQK